MHFTVLHIYKGLIQLAVTGADASCIYLESLSFSLPFLCTLVYTHGSPHTVTYSVTIWKLGRTVCVYSTRYGGGFAAPVGKKES